MPRPAFNAQIHERNQWLQSLDIRLLRQLAQQRGISNYEKLSHSQLVSALTDMNPNANPLSTRKTDHTIQ